MEFILLLIVMSYPFGWIFLGLIFVFFIIWGLLPSKLYLRPIFRSISYLFLGIMILIFVIGLSLIFMIFGCKGDNCYLTWGFLALPAAICFLGGIFSIPLVIFKLKKAQKIKLQPQ